MEYKNFNLRIENKVDGGYPVIVESEGMGEAVGVFTLSKDCEKIAEQLKNVQSLPAGSELPMNFGTSLYQCLFQKQIGRKLDESRGAVKGDEQGLRIRLRLSPSELAALPWEVLYDEDGKCFLATSNKTPLTRYIDLVEPIKALRIEPPVKVLTLIPAATGLNTGLELQILNQALAELPDVEMVVLRDKVARSHISRALVENRFHILHFIGHGTFEDDEGKLLINSEDGGEDAVPAGVFADFFRNHPSLKLVVLNSCQGAQVSATKPLAGVAPQLVARGIPAVVAMQYPITDDAALTFAKEFYLKLCTGWSRGQVDSAISHVRNRISMDFGKEQPLAFATPVLFLRSPTGVIFDLENEHPPGLVARLRRLVSGAPVKQVNRLKEVKKTYQNNIEVLQEKSRIGDADARQEAVDAIAREQEEIAAVDQRIVKWNRAFLVSLAVALVIFFLGYAGLFNIFHADDWLESRFIPYMDDYIVKKLSPDIRLIMSDEGGNGELGVPGPGWRPYHAALVDALAGKAKVIVFDLKTSDSTPADGELAAAIKRAADKGTSVVLGKGVRYDGVMLADIAHDLRAAVNDRWGNIDVVGQHWGLVRVYQLAQSGGDQSPAASQTKISVPSLALQAVAQFMAPNSSGAVSVDENRERIQITNGAATKSIPVYQTSDTVFDLPYDMVDYPQIKDATRSYSEVYRRLNDADYLNDFKDKIVVIGFKTPEELFSIAHGQRRYGAEIHANVISDILQDVYVRWLPASYDLLIVAVMAGAGALVQAKFPRVLTLRPGIPFTDPKKSFSVPVLLLLADVVFLLIAFLFYKFTLVYILRTYHLFTPFIAYWLTGKMRQGVNLKPSRGLSS